MRRLGLLAAAGTVALMLGAPVPAQAQWIVFDPNNYVQNVLTAARELQQINNQVTGLQNQTQMLLNQARNLATLPYSSSQTIEQSLARTVSPAEVLCLSSWQRKQPGQSLWPMLLG